MQPAKSLTDQSNPTLLIPWLANGMASLFALSISCLH
jgi:hypothetical protein